jgi:hypothetical protein
MILKLKDKSMDHAKYFYELSRKTAQNLSTSDFIRIGILINYSIFMANIMKNPEAAVNQIN